jgi:hypothetical protein
MLLCAIGRFSRDALSEQIARLQRVYGCEFVAADQCKAAMTMQRIGGLTPVSDSTIERLPGWQWGRGMRYDGFAKTSFA